MPAVAFSGIYLFAVGLFLAAVGLLLRMAGDRFPAQEHLPGDLRFGSGRVKVYIPFAAMILLSALVSGLVLLIRWLMNR